MLANSSVRTCACGRVIFLIGSIMDCVPKEMLGSTKAGSDMRRLIFLSFFVDRRNPDLGAG